MVRPLITDEATYDFALNFGKGEHHTANETEIPPGHVRTVSNFDINNAGTLFSRPLFVPIGAAGGHSMFTTSDGRTYYVSGSFLVRFDAGMTFPVLDVAGNTVVVPGASNRMWYEEADGKVYFSNGVSTGSIGADWRLRPWGIPNTLAQVVDDTASRTTFVTWIDDLGEESGAVRCDSSYPTMPVDNMTPTLYWSDTDSELFRQGGTGRELTTQGLIPMPACRFVTWFGGRLWGAAGDKVYYSMPYQLGLYDPAYNYIVAPGPVTGLGGATDGLYVLTATEAWYLNGLDPSKMTMNKVSDTGAFDGSQTDVPFKVLDEQAMGIQGVNLGIGNALGWITEFGLAIGLPSGLVRMLTADKLRLPVATTTRSSVIMRDGFNQIVAVVESGSLEGQGAAVDSPVTY